MGPEVGQAMLASVCLLMGIALASWELLGIIFGERPDHLLSTDAERRRRLGLRQQVSTYRWFEPLIDRMTEWNLRLWPEQKLRQLQSDLDLVVGHLHWKAGEFLACKQIESVPAFAAGLVIGTILFSVAVSPLVGFLAAVGYYELSARTVTKQAQEYRNRLRGRLPFVVEMMALMMESGASLGQCLETTARENRNHPIGEEFGRVHASMTERGIDQASALKNMADRLEDMDVRELVNTINTAERLGTPLEQTLRRLAEQMRLRSIQWHERAAEEAKVHVTWPAMIVMLACLMIVAAPFLLAAFSS